MVEPYGKRVIIYSTLLEANLVYMTIVPCYFLQDFSSIHVQVFSF